jgi:hypothetical protein
MKIRKNLPKLNVGIISPKPLMDDTKRPDAGVRAVHEWWYGVFAGMVVELVEARDIKTVKLTVGSYDIAMGIYVNGCNESELARRLDVTRAAVSKRVREIALRHNIPPSSCMRKPEHVEDNRKRATKPKNQLDENN